MRRILGFRTQRTATGGYRTTDGLRGSGDNGLGAAGGKSWRGEKAGGDTFLCMARGDVVWGAENGGGARLGIGKAPEVGYAG